MQKLLVKKKALQLFGQIADGLLSGSFSLLSALSQAWRFSLLTGYHSPYQAFRPVAVQIS